MLNALRTTGIDDATMRAQSLGILSNMCYRYPPAAGAVYRAGGVPLILSLVMMKDYWTVVMAMQCIDSLMPKGRFAPPYQTYFLECGAADVIAYRCVHMHRMITKRGKYNDAKMFKRAMAEDPALDTTLLRLTLKIIRNMFRIPPYPTRELLSPFMHVLVKWLDIMLMPTACTPPREVALNACALYKLVSICMRDPSFSFRDLLPYAARMLLHKSPRVVMYGASIVADISMGTEHQTNSLLTAGIHRQLLHVLVHTKGTDAYTARIIRICTAAVGNLCVGSDGYVRTVFTSGLVEAVITNLTHTAPDIRLESLYVVAHIAMKMSMECAEELVALGCLHTLCKIARMDATHAIALEILLAIMRTGGEGKHNLFACMLKVNGVAVKLLKGCPHAAARRVLEYVTIAEPIV